MPRTKIHQKFPVNLWLCITSMVRRIRLWVWSSTFIEGRERRPGLSTEFYRTRVEALIRGRRTKLRSFWGCTSKEPTCWPKGVTYDIWGQDPCGWAVIDPATKVVKSLATFYFDPLWAWRTVGEAKSDQSAGHIKVLRRFDWPDRILQSPIEVNEQPPLFILKVLESGR